MMDPIALSVVKQRYHRFLLEMRPPFKPQKKNIFLTPGLAEGQ